MKQILVVPKNLMNDESLGQVVVDMLGYIPSDIIQTEEYPHVGCENIHGYLNIKDSLQNIDLDFLDQYMTAMEEPEEYKTSAIFPIPGKGACVLLAANTVDRCKEFFNESSNYELNKSIECLLDRLDLTPSLNHFGWLLDDFHDKYYYGDKFFPLMMDTTGGIKINEENVESFSGDYENFIERYPEIIAGDTTEIK